MNQPLKVLVYLRESSARYRARLRDSAVARYTFCETEHEVAGAIPSADIILGSISFPAELLASAARLRWIQVTAAGVDRFLAAADLPSDVLLTRADVSFGEQIAEYVMGHLLAQTQRLSDVHALQVSHTWKALEVEFLCGRTMGIAGTGSIGCVVANRARAFGMRTLGLASAPRTLPEFDKIYGPDELDRFLPQLDVLTLCLPLTNRTRGLIGTRELSVMKRTSTLINVARGAIVDEDALICSLQHGGIGAAILDVFIDEPLPPESPFWGLPNATITSHHSGLNVPDEIIDFFEANLRRFRGGHPLQGLVDRNRGY